MKIEFNDFDWFDRNFADYDDQKNLNELFNKYLICVENLDKLIEKRRNMSDEEFIKVLSDIDCRYKLDTYDIVKIVSIMNNKKYIGCERMRTTMYCDSPTSKDCIDYNIIYTQESKFDQFHYYSIEEIQNLVNKEQIVLLNEMDVELWNFNDRKYRSEEYIYFETLDLNFDNYFLNSWFHQLNHYLIPARETNEYNKAVLKYIRLQLRKYKLESEMLKSLKRFSGNLRALDHDLKIYHPNQREICASNFEKNGYNDKLKQLTLKYNKKDSK